MTFHKSLGLTARTVDELAVLHIRRSEDPTDVDRMWGLFVEAVETVHSLPGPPRMSYPRKSPMSDTPDDVNYWQKVMAYLSGETEEIPETRTSVAATRAQMDRHDVIMDIWHRSALRGKGDWRRLRKALWAYAAGAKNGRVCRKYGLTRMGLSRLKKHAMEDMISCARKKGVTKAVNACMKQLS